MKAQIVSFHCVLKDQLGQVLGSSFNQDVINQLESSIPESEQKLRGLVAGLQNVREGEKRQFAVPATEAYGHYDPNLILTLRRSELRLGKEISIGIEVTLPSYGKKAQSTYRVTHIEGDQITLDGNHPLAGRDLVFDIEVVSARDAEQSDFDEPYISGTTRTVH